MTFLRIIYRSYIETRSQVDSCARESYTYTHTYTHTHPYLRTFPQRRFAAKNKPSCGEKADILISGLVQVKALRVPHLAPVPLSDQRVLF